MKKTEKVPFGWINKRLSYLIKSLDAGVSVNSDDRKADIGEYGILKTSAVTNGVFNSDENKVIIASEIKRAKISPTQDRIIMSRMNTPALVGANAYVPQTREYLFLPDRLWQLTPKEARANMRWLSFVLGSPKYRSMLSSFATGTSNSMKNIAKEDVKSLPILLPPLPEQKAIADLLSTWDEAIEKTERLIRANEKRFRGLLRSLISDKCAMKDGKSNWEKVSLGEVFGSRKEKGHHGIPTLSVTLYNGIVDRSEIDRKMETNLSPDKHLLIKSGDLAYNMMRMWQGASGLANTDGIVSPAYVVLKSSAYVDSNFAAYWFKSSRMIYLFWAYSYGLTEDRLRLYYNDFSLIKCSLPSLKEQQQIAETLTAAQKEIDLLKQLSEKYKTQKRGLMQKMLTGEWRVKPEIVKEYEEAVQ